MRMDGQPGVGETLRAEAALSLVNPADHSVAVTNSLLANRGSPGQTEDNGSAQRQSLATLTRYMCLFGCSLTEQFRLSKALILE
jgi:hypothetical protein